MELLTRLLDLLAAAMLALLPAALLFWLLVHPLARFWRRLGPAPSYAIVGGLCLAVAYGLWSIREPLMRVHYGYRPVTIGFGLALYLAGAAWDLKVLRRLRLPLLVGLPELSDGRPSRLLTEGPYRIVRHPRYLGALVGITGFALICNYLWLYLMVALAIPVGWIVVTLEERELRERFGSEYEAYCARVPRFLPLRRRG